MANPLDMKKYAVTGSPILFSHSPAIYNYLFGRHGISSHFTRLAADSPPEVVRLAKQIGLDGISITAPFKQSLLHYIDESGQPAIENNTIEINAIGNKDTISPINAIGNKDTITEINAVNAITNSGGRLTGYNTDTVGIAKSLSKYGFVPLGKRCLIIGAGGAACAAVYAMKQAGAGITIANRSADKGKELAGRFSAEFMELSGIGKAASNFDLIINTIPANAAALENIELRRGITLLDANYYDGILKAEVEEAGGQYIPGIDWLAGQAIPAFELFTGLKINRDERSYDILFDILLNQLKSGGKVNKPVALIGFTGSGKSTIGKQLAEKSDCEFTDLDLLVEKMAGKSIIEIFHDDKEQGFRLIETRALQSVSSRDNAIVACGGGIIEAKENIKLLKRYFVTIWLFASPDTCLRRIDAESKPMLSPAMENRNPVSLYTNRLNKYFLASDLIVNAENQADSIVQKIYEENYK